MIPFARPVGALRRLLCSAVCLLAAVPSLHAQQSARADTAMLQRVLMTEDARGTGPNGVAPLLGALTSSDSLIRRVAVRGLGRLQRPDLARPLIAALLDPVPSVRGEAANAIAQALSRVRRGPATDPAPLSVTEAQAAMTAALNAERDRGAAGAIAEAIGRLPYADSTAARAVERAIVARMSSAPAVMEVHGLYALAKARRFTGSLTQETIARLRTTALGAQEPEVRRLALLTLTTTAALDSGTVVAAARDADAQVRRLALAGVRILPATVRAGLIQRAISDTSPIVRVAAIYAARATNGTVDCAPIIGAVADHDAYVALAAIDSLGSPCSVPANAMVALQQVLYGSLPTFSGPPDHSWQAAAHALRSLARLDSASAARWLPRFTASPRWGERLAAAEAAANARDRTTLLRLTQDTDNNVREAALAGLTRVAKHEADAEYIAALGSPGYQVVLQAATSLAGSTHPDALPALLNAFDRLSGERKENAKDPRVAVLRRISEMGGASNARRLTPYLADFDTLIAATVASTLTRWTGFQVEARPAPLPIRPEPLAQVFLDRSVRLKVTMSPSSGGGVFVVELYPDEAPATVARTLRLVREHFYDGHAFQRVEPNFVVQGGGPDASEYVGDATFMRDELTARSHGIGTFGISSRGRDTGDAQWFINVVDNPLLDHEYTVFGRIVSGLGVARQILEGDTVGKVEIVKLP